MIITEKIVNRLTKDIKFHKEKFFGKKITITNYEIYPYYDFSLMTVKSGKIGNCSIEPIAILIEEICSNGNNEYYLYFSNNVVNNENNMDTTNFNNNEYVDGILKQFVDEILK